MAKIPQILQHYLDMIISLLKILISFFFALEILLILIQKA